MQYWVFCNDAAGCRGEQGSWCDPKATKSCLLGQFPYMLPVSRWHVNPRPIYQHHIKGYIRNYTICSPIYYYPFSSGTRLARKIAYVCVCEPPTILCQQQGIRVYVAFGSEHPPTMHVNRSAREQSQSTSSWYHHLLGVLLLATHSNLRRWGLSNSPWN